MYHKACEAEKMSDAALIRECTAPALTGETIKAQIARAARRLRWNPNRVFNVWYGRAELSKTERDQARDLMLKNTRNQEVLRHEFQSRLQAVIGVAEAMSRTDPGFYSAEIAQLRGLVGTQGGEDLA
jgi:hypothetical protein